MIRKHNLGGRIFGSMTVLYYVGMIKSRASWRVWCEKCHSVTTKAAADLLAGNIQTCGCGMITHGLCRGGKPYSYKCWIQVKDRCKNDKCAAWMDYGGRGIRICKGWDESFPSFNTDMGVRPQGYSLDRIDNNGHYSCGHCPECVANSWPMNCK